MRTNRQLQEKIVEICHQITKEEFLASVSILHEDWVQLLIVMVSYLNIYNFNHKFS